MLTKPKIFNVAVLGAGVMGSQIAAHCANADVTTFLFELPGNNPMLLSAPAQKAMKQLTKLKPSPLASNTALANIHACNYQTDLEVLQKCDLIIEAVAENKDIKQQLYNNIAPYINKTAIIASNTSGISINELANFLPESLRAQFTGIHFFNPPRYMPLVELIPCESTDKSLYQTLEPFLVSTLGKQVVYAKDTPNFIANRVGVFSILSLLHHADDLSIPFDVVDGLTGVLLGRPKSATFRTLDVVGLDTMAHVVNTMQQELKDDPWHKQFALPEWVIGLIKDGALGQKTRRGIYQKVKKTINVFDTQLQAYRTADKTPNQDVIAILKEKNWADKFKQLQDSQHPQAQLIYRSLRDTLQYCLVHLESIADTTRDVDLAIRYGFGWQQGPFELMQQIGMAAVLNTKSDASNLAEFNFPQWATEQRDVFTPKGGFNPHTQSYQPRADNALYQRQYFYDRVPGEKPQDVEVLFSNPGVQLYKVKASDVAILSFTSKANSIGLEVVAGIRQAVNIAEEKASGLVLWQPDKSNFSVGANLKEFGEVFKTGDKDKIVEIVNQFQQAALALKYSRIPTIAAVRGRALGGGCELAMHCDSVVAALEAYPGLVEIGVGLLPAGGGTKAFAHHAMQSARGPDLIERMQDAFATIAQGRVAGSAIEAIELGYFPQHTQVMFHPDEVLMAALKKAQAMADMGYRPPLVPKIQVAGRTGIANCQAYLVNMHQGHYITDYELELGLSIATVLCGGDIETGSVVNEAWLLKLERETFAQCAVNAKTQERIMHMLSTGKPLRN